MSTAPAKNERDEESCEARVAVRFSDETVLRLQGDETRLGRLVAQLDVPTEGELRLLPLFESLQAERLAELVQRAVELDPDYEPANFGAWYQIVCPADVDPDELAEGLRRRQIVQSANVMRPGPPPVIAMDDPRSANQGYLDAAPNGIDARYAWGVPGGDGQNVGFVDLEQGWNLSHEDLVAGAITLISGVNNAYPGHGTSVLGEVRMTDNTVGGVGIAPSCTARVISQWRTAASYNTADAIVDAADNMAFGDVLLLEAQEFDPVGGAYFWPVEIADANYDAIRLATALGIVVVEAGCNGSYDLDAYTNAAGKRIFDRTSADFRDSGAIMVGAGSSAAPHTRMSFSNHGNRIDCYAWGENIDTTSTNAAGTDNTAYTTGFNGTSGASPIVVGAAVIVQAIAETSLGYRFSPRALRAILVAGGTPSANPASDEIGVMPDLRAILTGDVINLAPDLYVRDYVGDSGDPTSGFVSQSPDIILRNAQVAGAPQAAFGTGSGTENDPNLSDQAQTGHDNYVYVRLLNRGGAPATAASVDVYWSTPSTLVTPNLWHVVGTANLASVPTGGALTVSDAITWLAGEIPAPGHYCFVAVAGNAADPKPSPAAFVNFDNYLTYIRNNNNVAWRNFDVVPGPPSGGAPGRYSAGFIIPGAFDTSRRFSFEAIGRLPAGSRAQLEVPDWFAGALRRRHCEIGHQAKRGRVRIPLSPHGAQKLGNAVLHAESQADCRVLVSIPDEHRGHGYELVVRQLYEGEEVGRVTWRFGGE